jgi:tetratricopeptide (TPR) repeat protein
MNTLQFIKYTQNPNLLEEKEIENLEKIIQNFPYFQPARALYLKGLYNLNSYKYNFELKKTAATTTERNILFDFITSKAFLSTEKEVKDINEITVFAYETVRYMPNAAEVEMIQENIQEIITQNKQGTTNTEKIEAPRASSNKQEENVLFEISEETFLEKIENQTIQDEEEKEENIAPFTINFEPIVEKLEIGKPIPFDENEKFSFFEWLKLTQQKPINRIVKNIEIEQKIEKKEEQVKKKEEKNISKSKKIAIIDQFLAANPKISPIKNTELPKPKIMESNDKSSLMTETLAKVYLEQKKYDKAIQAFQILILKNPEKSVYFADRIKDIKILQQNNN